MHIIHYPPAPPVSDLCVEKEKCSYLVPQYIQNVISADFRSVSILAMNIRLVFTCGQRMGKYINWSHELSFLCCRQVAIKATET